MLITEKTSTAGKKIYNSLEEFLMANVLQGSKLMSLGYINIEDVKKRIYVTPQLTKKMDSIIGGDNGGDDTYWKERFLKTRNSEEWSGIENGTLLNSKKQPRNFMANDITAIISFSTYLWNWQNAEAFGKALSDNNEQEANLRVRHGFGRGEENYPENDWRRKLHVGGAYNGLSKYHGLGARPIVFDQNKNNGNGFSDRSRAEYGMYGQTDGEGNPLIDDTGNQKFVFKQFISRPDRTRHQYFLVDEQGNVHNLPQNAYRFLKSEIGLEKAKETLDQEEQAFVDDMEKFRLNTASRFKTWDSEKIAYVVATPVTMNSTKDKIPSIYLNPSLYQSSKMSETGVNEAEVKRIISMFVDHSKEDVSLPENYAIAENTTREHKNTINKFYHLTNYENA